MKEYEEILPIERMQGYAEALHDEYRKASPFPHVVVEGFFDPDILRKIVAEFPAPDSDIWHRFQNAKEQKLESTDDRLIPPFTRNFLYHLNSATFLRFVETVTGINALISDPYFNGGGLHQIPRGGKLGIHVDYNRHPKWQLHRRVNLLLYLNEDWKEAYGGHLELWNEEVTQCAKRIAPQFNRMVIFGTTSSTYHGHPDPLKCPEGMTRKSLALYYFSVERPISQLREHHTTLFKARPGEHHKKSFREHAYDWLPPVLTRAILKFRERFKNQS